MATFGSRNLALLVTLTLAGAAGRAVDGPADQKAPSNPAGTRKTAPDEVIAVRELQLKAGADAAQFEQFVRGTYNQAWIGAVPGVRGYIGRADRGAQKDAYALFLVFDSRKTRDTMFPKEGGGAAPAFASRLQPLLALNQELEKYLEPASLSVYTDYVAIR